MLDELKLIDTGQHIIEPRDVWTARVSKKWIDAVSHIRRMQARDFWFVGEPMTHAFGLVTMVVDGSYPDHPTGYDDIPASAFDARLTRDQGVT